jgi:lysophospholipase L1-like esterase
MKLFTYGDSWTEGAGVDVVKENLIETREERKKFRNDRSWPTKLSKLMNLEVQNQAISGSNNNFTFNEIIENIKSNIINPGDLIIVMWTSSLRDDVPFFPKNEWHTWGSNFIKENYKQKWFVSKDLTKNSSYNDFLINYKEFFIGDLFTQDYYNIVNQNYILFIQKLCEHYQINYIFCDAFDKMIDDIKLENDKTKLINKNPYWGFGEKTFKDFLISKDNKMVWELPQLDISKTPGMHPSEIGYEFIAEEIYRFINSNKNNIIRYDNNKKIKIL